MKKRMVLLLLVVFAGILTGCNKEAVKDKEANKQADFTAAVASKQLRTQLAFEQIVFKKAGMDITASGKVKAAESPFYYRVEQPDGKVLVREQAVSVSNLNTSQSFSIAFTKNVLTRNDVVILVLYGKKENVPIDENYIPIEKSALTQ